MAARPTRRLNPATEPAPAGPTPFADAALNLRGHGLAPIPLGGDDGKVPLVRFKSWKLPPGRQFLERLTQKHPTANVGILTGLSGVTVVDIDDPALTDGMVRRFGDTPLKTATPSGGVHLYYKSNGERCQNLRYAEGLAVDIKGVGGMVVVPPSVRPSGQHKGKPYAFLEGSWGDLCRLPEIKPTAPPPTTTLWAVPDGYRDTSLYLACLDEAPHCDTFDALLDVARTINASYRPPKPDSVVIAKAKSAWQCEVEGRNWRGHRGHGAHIPVAERMLDQLLTFDRLHGSDALVLYVKLQAKHAARDKRGESFAVAAKAMARDRVLPWSDKRKYCAITVLANFGLLERVKTGGRGKGDMSQFRFRSPPPALVPELGTNVIRHPSPPLPLSPSLSSSRKKE